LFEDVNLIQELRLLFLFQVLFVDNLDCPESATFSVIAFSDFSIRA
jgi:hypothetical protein